MFLLLFLSERSLLYNINTWWPILLFLLGVFYVVSFWLFKSIFRYDWKDNNAFYVTLPVRNFDYNRGSISRLDKYKVEILVKSCESQWEKTMIVTTTPWSIMCISIESMFLFCSCYCFHVCNFRLYGYLNWKYQNIKAQQSEHYKHL